MPGAAPFDLDEDAIRELAQVLGLRYVLIVRWADPDPGRPKWLGFHRWRGSGHTITLYRHSDRSRLDCQRTLLHELCHAADAEECGSLDAWNRAYESDPDLYEHRARTFAIKLAHHVQLVTSKAVNKALRGP
jgi:hypothetical protein